MSVAQELEKLQQLHQSGALSDQEYAKAKQNVLDGGVASVTEAVPAAPAADPAKIEQETRTWGLLLHLSLLAGYVTAGLGFVAPIVIWQLKKNELPLLDQHGKNAVNWLISKLIYAVVCFLLFFVIVGIPLLVVLGILGIIFPIIAGVKANNGVVWKYPLAITFLK
jgi:uncharacterized Tic20 family protein